MDPIVGRGKYTYRVNEEWQRVPEWLDLKRIHAADCCR